MFVIKAEATAKKRNRRKRRFRRRVAGYQCFAFIISI